MGSRGRETREARARVFFNSCCVFLTLASEQVQRTAPANGPRGHGGPAGERQGRAEGEGGAHGRVGGGKGGGWRDKGVEQQVFSQPDRGHSLVLASRAFAGVRPHTQPAPFLVRPPRHTPHACPPARLPSRPPSGPRRAPKKASARTLVHRRRPAPRLHRLPRALAPSRRHLMPRCVSRIPAHGEWAERERRRLVELHRRPHS